MASFYSNTFPTAYKRTNAKAKTMKPEKLWTNPVAYAGPQTSETNDKKTIRRTLVAMAIGIVEQNKRIRLYIGAFIHQAKMLPRAVKEIRDRRPLQISSTTTWVCCILRTLPDRTASSPMLLRAAVAICAAKIFILKLILVITTRGTGIMNMRKATGNVIFLRVFEP